MTTVVRPTVYSIIAIFILYRWTTLSVNVPPPIGRKRPASDPDVIAGQKQNCLSSSLWEVRPIFFVMSVQKRVHSHACACALANLN